MAFNLSNTFSQSKKPFTGPTPWVRPADWITITDDPNKCQFLVCDEYWNRYCFTTTYVAPSGQNLYIDWGDGTIDTITSTAQTFTTHTYTTGGTPCSRGYNTWKVQVYTDPGGTVLAPYFIRGQGLGDPFETRTVGVLEIVYGDNVQFNTFTASTTNIPQMSPTLLEYVKLPNVLIGNGATTFPAFNSNSCPSLAKVVMPTSAPGFTDFGNTFATCNSLQGPIVIPQDCTGITTMGSCFQFCGNLTSVTLPPTLDSCGNYNTTFANSGITSIVIPSSASVTSFQNAFQNCKFLTWVRFNALPGTQGCDWSSAFNGCSGLKYLYFPPSIGLNGAGGNQWTMSSTFNLCNSLETITFPSGFNTSTGLASAFTTCTNLLSVHFQGPCPSLVSLATTFSGCASLQTVTLPTSNNGSSIIMNGTFQNCRALTSATIPNTYLLANTQNTFNGCLGLETVSLPNTAQNTTTTLFSCFTNCYNLTSVVMPPSMNACTTMQNIFQGCFSLKTVVFPSSVTGLQTMQNAFNSCWNLTSVTLPTSMPALTGTGLNSAFENTVNLRTLTLPATVAATMSSLFNLVANSGVETVTLPTTQMTSMATVSGAFNNARNLKTINNMDKIGNTSTTVGNVLASSFLTFSPSVSSATLACRLTQLQVNPNAGNSLLTSLRLTNTGTTQWSGTSPQINVSYTGLSTAALNTLFADIAAQGNVTSKTINITSAAGAAGLSAGDRLVLTSRGWTITG